MKKFMTTAMVLSGVVAFAQRGNIGVNSVSPQATLEINVAGINEDNDKNQGIIIPRLSKKRLAKISDGNLVESTLVYVNEINTPAQPNSKVDNVGSKGFYLYDGSAWQPLQKSTPRLDYIVSTDGSILMQWMNKRTETVDMNQYADMADVEIIEEGLLRSSRVKKFIIREGVKEIGKEAFANNPDMEITLPQSLTTIEERAFYENKKINPTNLSLPNLTTIGQYAFYNNTSLTSVNLPQVTTIGEYTFQDNTSLTSVNLPQATTIGGYAFYGNTSLTSVNLPQATTIGQYAFSNNTSLTSIDLPNVTTIGYGAFSGNTSLTNVTIGANIQSMFASSFGPCTVTIQATTPPIMYDALSFISTTFRVPMASVDAYKAKWRDLINIGFLQESQIVGY